MAGFQRCTRTEIDGIEVSIMAGTNAATLIQTKLIAALALIRECDAKRYRYLLRDVKRIMVSGDSIRYCGRWRRKQSCCQLAKPFVLDAETTPAILASTLVHEAMHARLHRWNIGYEEVKRARVERICYKAEIAFARRLPVTETASREVIMDDAQWQIERDPIVWTEEGRLDEILRPLRNQGCPIWLMAIIRKSLLRIRRWVKDKRKMAG